MNSGDPCPECGRKLSVYCTRRIGNLIVRFIGCRRLANAQIPHNMAAGNVALRRVSSLRNPKGGFRHGEGEAAVLI